MTRHIFLDSAQNGTVVLGGVSEPAQPARRPNRQKHEARHKHTIDGRLLGGDSNPSAQSSSTVSGSLANDRFARRVVRATRSRRRDLAFSHAITISRPFRPSRFFMAIFVSCKHYRPCLLLKSEQASRQRSLKVRQTGSARARCLARRQPPNPAQLQ